MSNVWGKLIFPSEDIKLFDKTNEYEKTVFLLNDLSIDADANYYKTRK
jgi:hypothetical protein